MPMPQQSHSTAVTLLALILFVDIVHAQQPIAELGGWPPGSFTLLVGLWLAIDSLSKSRFDVLPPILFARVLHLVPSIRRFLTLKQRLGYLTKELVLLSPDPGRCPRTSISQEWDVLIIQPGEGERIPWSVSSENAEVLKIEISDQERSFELEINAGVDVQKFAEAAPILLDNVFSNNPKKFSAQFQRYWYALQMYRNDPQLVSLLARGEYSDSFRVAIDYFKSQIGSPPRTASDMEQGAIDRLTNVPMSAAFPDSQCGPNELPIGSARTYQVMTARDLAAMLALTEFVCDPRKTPHPLLLWIFRWINREPGDNVMIGYPESKRLTWSQDEYLAKIVLDLSSDEWHLDGGSLEIDRLDVAAARGLFNHPHLHLYRLVIGFSSLFSVFTISFFAILAGSPPLLATTLSLLFCKPYSVDVPFDLRKGISPSWNGHTRIRWGDGYSVGFFRGVFSKKLGPSGNGLFRTSVVWIVSWITWHFRTSLRHLLQFGEPRPPSNWVRLAAICVQALAMVFFGFAFLASGFGTGGDLKKQGAFLFIFWFYIAYVTVLMFQKHEWLFFVFEFGPLSAIPYAAIIPRGVAPTHFPFFSLNAALWLNIIASSCLAPP